MTIILLIVIIELDKGVLQQNLRRGDFINILEVIRDRYTSFSKLHKQLADYVKNNLVDIAFMNITELSEKSGVSSATITRFVKLIDYESFSEFQKDIKEVAKKEIIPVKEFKYFVQETPEKNILYDQIQESIKALDSIYSEELYSELEAASNSLCEADDIYILASRSTFSMAYYCYFSLKRFQKNVYLIENRNDDISVNLQYVTGKDVLLAIGYPQYTNFTVNILKYFKDKGCRTICITDSHNSPLSEYATHLLIVKNRLKIYFVTTIAVINALIVMTGKNNPKLNIAGFEEENEVTAKLDVYLKK